MKTIPVLIIGGGPVGLSMALNLARQNIQSLVIERHPSTTNHPRARGVNVRTMELFRQWGNDLELLNHEQAKEARRIIWAQSLQGAEVTRINMDDSSNHKFSPAHASLVSQDRVEESLYHRLLQYPIAQVEFFKECLALEETANGVIASILNRETQQQEFISAQYLIAADGAHSPIRKKLAIDMHGPDNLGQFCNVYCEVDLKKWTEHRPFIGMLFIDKKLSGRLIASVDGSRRWIFGMRFSAEMSKDDFTDDYCRNEIRRVVGDENLAVTIINKNFWTMAAQIAEKYQQGRIFLVGDAAHRLPPTGGFGMNTGIQDAHNLAWKLAYVLKYSISEKLLATYYEERAPVAKRNIEWSTENAKRYDEINAAIRANDLSTLENKLHEQHNNLNYSGLDLGFIYQSSNIISEHQQELSISPAEYIPTSLPGSRAPHISLTKDNKTLSSLDLFEHDFVLLIGANGEPWRTAANTIAKKFAFPLRVYKIANDGDFIDPENNWQRSYQMGISSAVLVRPDGHIAWRSETMVGNLENILEQTLKLIGLI